jgi:hypothetical protein
VSTFQGHCSKEFVVGDLRQKDVEIILFYFFVCVC